MALQVAETSVLEGKAIPQGLKPDVCQPLCERLKSCPDTKQSFRQPVKAVPFLQRLSKPVMFSKGRQRAIKLCIDRALPLH